mmetsp:Transcript_8119/g.19218  ORF Transcript_8119/g.19218 Transcript_8119/m.19218 type:complete len:494 (-) Transcript_8119:142-1623(-)
MAATPVMQFGAANFGHVSLPSTLPPHAVRDDDDSRVLDEDDAFTVATEGVAPVSAFVSAKSCAPDPILGIRDAFLQDPATHKLNLAVGVYRTAEGKPLVLECVKSAEAKLLEEQRAGRTFKEYLPPEGMSRFCDLSLRLLLGDAITPALEQGRVVAAQSISGTGGLHLAARMLQILRPGSTVHLPTPTWPIHPDIFTAVGLAVAYYPYYDARTGGLDFDGMLAALQALPAGSVVLLHACAHNPTGVDPTAAQWACIAQAVARPLIPLIDAAYQGFASGDLDDDAAGARALASVPGVEMITVQSYSKNMGLYAERAGVVSFTCQDAAIAERLGQQLRRTIRLTHSSPPQHGAALVATILGEPERCAAWRLELEGMAARLHGMRRALHAALERVESPPPGGARDWRRVLEQRGMFTYTGLSCKQVTALREQHHIYMPTDGRLCMAALTQDSCTVLAAAIKDVLLAKRDEEQDARQEQEEEPAKQAAAPAAKRPRA